MIDAGERTLRCSSCNRGLAVVKVVDAHLPKKNRVRATCPYGCVTGGGAADTSFWTEFTGRFFPGGFGPPKPDAPEFMELKTKIVDYVTDELPDGTTVVTLVTARA
jgi:hypothetical protein